MASNWRQNVADIGLVDGPFDLVAGLFGLPGQYIGRYAGSNPPAYSLMDFPSFLGNLPVITFTGTAAIGAHFPFGFAVDPD